MIADALMTYRCGLRSVTDFRLSALGFRKPDSGSREPYFLTFESDSESPPPARASQRPTTLRHLPASPPARCQNVPVVAVSCSLRRPGSRAVRWTDPASAAACDGR